jgi:hypothetical protein
MAIKERDRIPLGDLKGVNVYCEDDLHDLALWMMKLNDARAKYEGSTTISRPTLNGLANRFAQLIDPMRPDYETVLAVVEKHGLHLGAVIDFDDRIER